MHSNVLIIIAAVMFANMASTLVLEYFQLAPSLVTIGLFLAAAYYFTQRELGQGETDLIDLTDRNH